VDYNYDPEYERQANEKAEALREKLEKEREARNREEVRSIVHEYVTEPRQRRAKQEERRRKKKRKNKRPLVLFVDDTIRDIIKILK
jgi:hypothetical protein